MKFEELLVLLPCHSLEDFPLYHEGNDADGLLAAWSALWHPALLANARRAPGWARVDCPPLEIAGRLLVVPQVGRDQLPEGFAERCQTEGAVLIRGQELRSELVAQALQHVDGGAAGVTDEVAADFLALGFARLQIELLTRQMRYTSHIDEGQLEREVLLAADAAIGQDAAETQIHLQKCFDVLYESRKYFYPVDAFLIDLTLVASSTLGTELRDEIATSTAGGMPVPINLLVAADVLGEMAAREPLSLAAIRDAWAAGQIGLAGGELCERELPLLPLETILADLKQGIAEYQRLLGKRPAVYGRRRYGPSPLLPQILSKLGFSGVLHFTLDDGHFPLGTQCKTRWEGLDHSAIEALVRLPRDAARPETFLEFSRKLGESMDNDHVATVVFAHWPGAISPWYADMRRVARFTPALGKFVTLEEYFGQTDFSGRFAKFLPDDYRAPYLKQAIIRRQENPISALGSPSSFASDTVGALAAIMQGRTPVAQTGDPASQAYKQFAAALPRQVLQAASRASDSRVPAGWLMVNPLSYLQKKAYVRYSDQLMSPPRASRSLSTLPSTLDEATWETDTCAEFGSVDIPALGFAWIDAAATRPVSAENKKRAPWATADDNVLRNEFMEVTISKTTGGIASIYDFRTRANRLSQQLALRMSAAGQAPGELWRDPDEDVEYSVMVADDAAITKVADDGAGTSIVRSIGKLVDRTGRVLARFTQVFYLFPSSRLLHVHIELKTFEEPRADPWNSYYAARFAWHDATAEMARSLGLCRVETDAKRIESPGFVEIVADKTRTSICSSLPYHRRVGMRMLDTLLKVRGESAHFFRLAIGIDVPNPAQAALEQSSSGPAIAELDVAPPIARSGWLFHIDARNVVATHWEPLIEQARDTEAGDVARPVIGFSVRILETLGLAGRVTLRCFRSVAEAHSVDFLGQPLAPLIVEDDKIVIEFGAYEWLEIQGIWK